jgi:chromate reductase
MRVLGISGSLRAGSYNTQLLRAAAEVLPDGVKLELYDGLRELPPYDQDVEDAGAPPAVQRLRGHIAGAAAVLIATPEYNGSLPGLLKNAIDWASRPPNQAFQDKPAAMFSCAPGPLGGGRVQYDLRRILVQLWSYPLPRPEVFIGMAPSKFAEGKLTDETTRKFLTELLAGFKDWILRMQRK